MSTLRSLRSLRSPEPKLRSPRLGSCPHEAQYTAPSFTTRSVRYAHYAHHTKRRSTQGAHPGTHTLRSLRSLRHPSAYWLCSHSHSPLPALHPATTTLAHTQHEHSALHAHSQYTTPLFTRSLPRAEDAQLPRSLTPSTTTPARTHSALERWAEGATKGRPRMGAPEGAASQGSRGDRGGSERWNKCPYSQSHSPSAPAPAGPRETLLESTRSVDRGSYAHISWLPVCDLGVTDRGSVSD